MIVALLGLGTYTSGAYGATIAYDVMLQTGNQPGLQPFLGSLGMDFNVNSAISVSSLGVFDSQGMALARPLTAYIYNRVTQTAVASLTFAPGLTGTLINGSRFLNLAMPLILPVGFQGSVVAEGFNRDQQNGNSFQLPPFIGPTLNSGGGALSFVGTSRYGIAGVFPNTPDAAVNQYGAGTFAFDPITTTTPEPASILMVSATLFILMGLTVRKRRRS